METSTPILNLESYVGEPLEKRTISLKIKKEQSEIL